METDTKKSQASEEEVVKLKDGQKVEINGQEFVFNKSKFSVVPPEECVGERDYFSLFFSGLSIPEGVTEVKGCPVKQHNKLVEIDILPLLQELFKSEAWLGQHRLVAVQGNECNQNSVDSAQIVLPHWKKDDIQKKFDRMLDMAIVNQNQLKGFKSYIDEVFGDLWVDFWHLW